MTGNFLTMRRALGEASTSYPIDRFRSMLLGSFYIIWRAGVLGLGTVAIGPGFASADPALEASRLVAHSSGTLETFASDPQMTASTYRVDSPDPQR